VISSLVVILAIVVVVVGVAAWVKLIPHAPPGISPQLVPAAWATYRTSVGHTLHVGQKNVTCKDCHDYEREGFKNPGAAPCVHCHAKQAAKAHTSDEKHTIDCVTCHVFAPDKEPPRCIGCHGEAVSGPAHTPGVAKPEGALSAIHTHATTDCSDCHRMHDEPKVVVKDCAGCHTETAASHAEHAGTKGCQDCHRSHEPAARARVECAGCHKTPAGPKPASHDACLTCHEPHDFVATPAGCAECHAGKPTLLAATTPAHAICTSCHVPHAPETAAASCAGCHTTTKVSHHGDRTSCTGCHEPHGADPASKVTSCTSCHANMLSSGSPVHAPGVACSGCHKPHDFAAAPKPTLCATCHAREVSLTNKMHDARPATVTSDHTTCASCHGASTHAPTAAPPCATCHAEEQKTAPTGHQACTSCHDAHSGETLPQAECKTCHAKEAASPHGALSSGCASCHRPHGPKGPDKAPACASCHAKPELPALHQVAAHGSCAGCHDSHGPPRSDRATCTTGCHADRRQHHPEAPTCAGCHVFRRGAAGL
jgi:hypothetical protein